jgi:hypothetical protein
VSRFGDKAWPLRSPDLSACHFIWGYLKQKVYVKRPNTLQDLNDKIRADIARIPPGSLRKVLHSVRRRVKSCMESGGIHRSDTIFKK